MISQLFHEKGWLIFKIVLRFLLVFGISYAVSWRVIKVTNVQLISAINLSLFSFLLSLVMASVVFLLEERDILFHLKMRSTSGPNRLIESVVVIIIGTLIVVFLYATITFRGSAFEEWSLISPIWLLFFLVIFSLSLFAPAYIIHETFLQRFKLSIVEKCAFYPVISAVILVLPTIIGTTIGVSIPSAAIFVVLMVAMLIVFLNGRHRTRNPVISFKQADINLTWVLVITAVIGFNLFLFFSAIGGWNAFLRGDMWGEANAVAFMNNYGLKAYMTSPIEGYPPFYALFWSAITGLAPFPFLNGLLIVAFFDHLFSVIAFYLLARALFRDQKAALLAVVLWATLSGFSWVGVSLNPPNGVLSGTPLFEYISAVAQHFGVHSGSIVSPTFADDQALTRLFSISLMFISIAALLKSYFKESNRKMYLLIFSICTIQILLGHVIEVPIIALALFIIVLIGGKTSSGFTKASFWAALISSTVGASLIVLLYGLNAVFILISFSPLLGVFFAVGIRRSFDVLRNIRSGDSVAKLSRNAKMIFFILFLYVYGLMWLAFSSSNVSINWEIATVWYSPAVEWGFLGLLSVLTLAWFGLKKSKLQLGLKFAILLFLLQLLLLIGLNCLNFNLFYIQTPYPFLPILFLPVLALIASQGFTAIDFKKRFRHKTRFLAVFAIVIIVFSVGSLDYISSTSFWNTNNGWWWGEPLNPSSSDYQLINYLYAHPSASSFIGTFQNQYDPSSYVVYPSGATVLSQPLIDILTTTNDSREVYLLTKTLPIDYILTSNSETPPATFLSFNGKDDYVETQNSASLDTPVFTIEAWVKLSSYSPYLCPIVDRANDVGGYSFWIGGESHSLGQLILNGGFNNQAQSNNLVVPLNEWTQIAVVYDGNTTTFYENNVSEVGNGYQFHDIGSLTTRIGNERWAYGGQFFNGSISDVRIYNKALTSSEVYSSYNQNNQTQNNLSLWLPLNSTSDTTVPGGTTVPDLSGNGNNGVIYGAQWQQDSYLLSAISNITPIFENDKYKLYSVNQLSLLKTDLPNSDNFITAEEITFKGDINYKDNLNQLVQIQNTTGAIYPLDNGSAIISTQSLGNTITNNTILTPTINIIGNVTLVEMKSTWGYFESIGGIADQLSMSGQTSFKLFNTFTNRIYMENFSYTGTYTASPPPTSLSSYNSKEIITAYLQSGYVNPLRTITSNLGLLWTFLVAIILFFALVPTRISKRFWPPKLKLDKTQD